MSQKAFYEHDDYRILLHEKFIHLKSTRKGTSLQSLGDSIGISRSFLKMVLDQERHLSIDKLSKVASAFRMNRDEKKFFIFLACQNLVEAEDMSEFFGDVLRLIRANKGKDMPSAEEELAANRLFESSLNMTIKSLRRLKNYRESPEWIQEQLCDKKVTLTEISRAIAEINDAQVPKSFVQATSGPGSGWEIAKVGLRLASKVYDTPEMYKPLRYSMCSLAFNDENEKKAFDLFVEFQEKLKDLAAQSQDPKSVLFISNNMFCTAYNKEP